LKKSSNTIFRSGPKNGDGRVYYRYLSAFAFILIVFFALLFITGFLEHSGLIKTGPESMTQDELYSFAKIRDVHLQFKDSTWQALQPFGGPYGIDGEGIGVYDFSPIPRAMFMYNGDTNRDLQMSREEFINLAEKWFKEWDPKGDGQLDAQMIGRGFGNMGMDFRGEKGRRNGIGSILGIQTRSVKADLEYDGRYFSSASVRFKGSGSLLESNQVIKRPFKIDLNEGFPNRRLAGAIELNFQNLYADPSFINDAISYRLYRDAKVPGPRTSYARIFVTNSDTLKHHYFGLYLLLENVDNNFAQNWYGTKKGSIFKPVTPRLFEYLGPHWNDEYNQTYDPQTTLSKQETNRLIEVCKFVSTSTDEVFTERLHKYFDLDNLARYMAVTAYIVDLDGVLGPGQNLYMYMHPKTMRLSFIPWDHDRSFGQYRGTQEELENLSLERPWLGTKLFLKRLYNDQQFQALYKRYLNEFHSTIFKPERFISQVAELAKTIRPAIHEESPDKLKQFDIKVGLSSAHVTDSTKEEELKPLIEFVGPRYKALEDQLAGRSSGKVIEVDFRFFGDAFMRKMDTDKSATISHGEFIGTFQKWFDRFADPKTQMISRDAIKTLVREGIFSPEPEVKKTEAKN
jgi:spore coat protein H